MLASARMGDLVQIKLTNGSTKIIRLKEIKTYGVEGEEIKFKEMPLTFYPFHNILYIRKDTDV